jgi:hypothetical protein
MRLTIFVIDTLDDGLATVAWLKKRTMLYRCTIVSHRSISFFSSSHREYQIEGSRTILLVSALSKGKA